MIEILVSLFVVSALLGVMSVIVINSSSINARTSLRTEAASLAFKKIQDYINLDFDAVPIGSNGNAYEIEDFSTEAQNLNLANATAKVYAEPETQLQTYTTTTVTNFSQSISADAGFVAGSEIDSVDYDDALGIHRRPWRIRDGNHSNYTYNRFSPGADNKPLPSIDLGSSRDVDTIRITWWSCFYGANDFRIEAKDTNPNSNSGWTTIVSGIADTCSGSLVQDVDVSANATPYRHWRMYVVDGRHTYWNVISEFEAFSGGVPGDIVEQHGTSASSSPGQLYFSSSELQMANDGARGQQSVGIIFDDIDTPQAANVTNAYIEFTADASDAGPVTLRVTGVDVNDAGPWVGSFAVDNAVDANNADGRTGTSAVTTWNPGEWNPGDVNANTRVDVTAIVQEIVNRAGWAVDNDMAFAVQYVSGSGRRVAERTPAPALHIDWSQSTTTTSTGIYVDANGDGDVDNPTLIKLTTIIEYDAFEVRQKVQYTTLIRRFGVGE